MKFNRFSLSSQGAALLTFCLLPAGHLLAQELELPSQEVVAAPVADENGYQAKRASTASKSSVALKDEAQSVQVVTPQTIEDFQVRSLDDAMKFVSGMTQSNTLAGTQDGFVKRGFGSNADGSILRDGIRSSLSRNFSATTERVEVLKGPASLLYGALESGGLINVISKKPQYQWNTRLNADSSSFGGGSLAVDVTGPIADSGLAFRLVAERQHEDYWRNFGEEEHSLIAPSLSWEGERLRLNIAYEYKEYSTPVDRGTVIINGKPAKVSYNDRFGESWSKAEGIDELLTATAEYQLSDDWSTRLTYGWNNERYDYAEARPNALNATTGALSRRSDGSEHDNQTQYLAWDWIGNASLFSQRHDLLIGADTERVDNFRGDTWRGPAVGGFNIYNPIYGNLAAPSLLNPAQSDRSDELHSRSIYAKDNWHLNDQWIVVLGGRYQRFEQLVEQGRGATYTRTTDRTDTTFLPFGGLVFQLSDQVAFYGNYSRSFVPNASDTNTGQAFDPEEGRSYELGVKFDLPQGIGASLALFDIEKKNVVVTNNSVSEAAGKVGSRGVELDISGRLSEHWELLGSYAYTDTEILDDPSNEGNELVNAARNVGSLYLVHHLHLPQELGQWKLGGGARYVGERAGDNANTFWLDSYTVADAFVTWDSQLLGEKTRLQLNVRNLFNERYYPSSGGNLRVAVGEPRELRLSASVEF
ncbi:iron complex outermembrane recepter protein [Ectopseudomonas chengduensis]|uniref:Iron complex outermembrane recepter protein n=1 Tax=Ectopseudomonas chengduensis TaxID=489632 RepID=A0A1G6KIM0_9GAMM|nr:TonB-dependent siderophore receptor [Pseudomonas chengduensis]MBP3060959.1 TonB-dependent siderophore receptor [Pseudomonas chengduensis]NNB74292.1 TonB-dependent siderophore receptor [Pseudomonas chengduensis]SDC30813.1 iron complex outermembrane recepter protein [Pseudomonas chengduensis]